MRKKIHKKRKYPTKSQILKCPIIPTKKDIEIVKEWKKAWKNKENIAEIKRLALTILLLELIENKDKKRLIKIMFNTKTISAHYVKKYNIIVLNNTSIITALHELGHAIYGNSELKACSWSIKLFKEAFPKAFNKLEWRGHMLKQK